MILVAPLLSYSHAFTYLICRSTNKIKIRGHTFLLCRKAWGKMGQWVMMIHYEMGKVFCRLHCKFFLCNFTEKYSFFDDRDIFLIFSKTGKEFTRKLGKTFFYCTFLAPGCWKISVFYKIFYITERLQMYKKNMRTHDILQEFFCTVYFWTPGCWKISVFRGFFYSLFLKYSKKNPVKLKIRTTYLWEKHVICNQLPENFYCLLLDFYTVEFGRKKKYFWHQSCRKM